MTTPPKPQASITVTKALELEILSFSGGAPSALKVKLTRLKAQELADTLRAFAIGSTTKSVGGKKLELILCEDTSGQPMASSTPVVHLNNPRR